MEQLFGSSTDVYLSAGRPFALDVSSLFQNYDYIRDRIRSHPAIRLLSEAISFGNFVDEFSLGRAIEKK